MDFSNGNCTSEPTERVNTEEIISTVKTMLIHSIALNNSEGFTMALEALEHFDVGLNWSACSKSMVPICDDWNTPLTLSAKLGRESMVAILLEKGSNANLFSQYKNEKPTGLTALHAASRSGHLQIVDCLLRHGCNVNITDARGWMPIHNAICQDNIDCAFKLLEYGANPLKSFSISLQDTENVNDIGRSSLMSSTRPYELAPFMPLSVTWNCLFLAANCHQPQLVAKLIQDYFLNDVNCQSPCGKTALHEAVILPQKLNLNEEMDLQKRHETMKILLDSGVDPNIPDHMGKTALHIFFDHANFYKVVLKKYPQIVSKTIRLLQNYGADLNMVDFSGRTVVHQAAAFGDLETTQILLELGASVISLDHDSNTPAHVAAYHGNFAVLQSLLNRTSHAEFVNRHGDTVLHVAIMANTADDDALLKIAQTLKGELAADKLRKNFYGETEYDLAAKFKLERLSCLLTCQTDKTISTNSTPVPSKTGNVESCHNSARLKSERNESVGGNETSARFFDKKHEMNFKSGNESEFEDCCDKTEVPELFIEKDTNVNEYLLELCHEYRVRSFHMNGEGKCHERCTVAIQALKFVENLLKLVAEDEKKLYCEVLRTGSAFEGYRIGKPDEFDFMCELKSLSDENCEIFETKEPGFVRIQIKEDSREEWKMFLSKEGFLDAMKVKSYLAKCLYIKSSKLTCTLVHKTWRLSFNTTSYDSCVLCHPLIKTSKAGVKMTLFWRGSIYKFMPIDIDITPAVHFSNWPKSAKVPPRHVLEGCADFGYHVVPKSEGGDTLLWRLSFSVAELKILQNASLVQGACYTALKIIKDQTALRSCTQRFSHLGFLHTYVLKTKFFEELERSDNSELWQENKLTDRVCSVLESTASLLTQKGSSQVESYFLPGHSLITNADKHFGKFVAASIKTTLRNVVRLLRKEPGSSLETVDDTHFTMTFDRDSNSESDDDGSMVFTDLATVAPLVPTTSKDE